MVGKVDEAGAGLVETAFRCLSAAVGMVQPGCMYRDLGASIGKIARENGQCGQPFGVFAELFLFSSNRTLRTVGWKAWCLFS